MVGIIFLIFLIAFSFLMYMVTDIYELQDSKYQSMQLLANMYKLNYQTQSILTSTFHTTKELRANLLETMEDFEESLYALSEVSRRSLPKGQFNQRMYAAFRLWEITKEHLQEILNTLDALWESGLDSRKGPMSSITYYHSHLGTGDLVKNKDHYYIVKLENTIENVLATSFSYNTSLLELTGEIKQKADTYIRLSLIISILLILGFVTAALVLVFLFGHQALARQVDRLLKEAVRNVEEKRKAQLKALQFQINPHFLYNTIGTVRLTAVKNGDREVGEMLLVLSRLLRNTTSKTVAFIPLHEELESLKDYIHLLQIRYKNRLHVTYSIGEDLFGHTIPSMLFQPLVENAVLHGLNSRLNHVGGEAELAISGEKRGDSLLFTIRDNGVGMKDEQIQGIFNSNIVGESRNGHIGIKNIQDRIVYNFGKDFGVHIKSKVGEFTCVIFRLPAITDTEHWNV